ncbi:alpha/beta fold hydrolase [Cognatishimia sp. SS12]|uniref:alpha/beta fold hydrolase n=1 Tax=Cognatishimia sp. SS12 TaxID=2979465 RepID=UPI00232DF701|nr:alpha/beta fold hydrolase [Cognatishimia sp. SS12]MDC0736709.1 alpha/beta fold hydrolase [Cognatishimia sp. SS12]
MLNMITHGSPTDQPPLLIVHGLYGSARNWGVVSKKLSDERQVIAVDNRNHGDSKRTDSHSYHDLASDLAEVLADIGPADVMGHSMGGKAAMVLAVQRPELVNRLIVADIAPVAYGHTQLPFIHAMRAVDLEAVEKRSDALEMLAAAGVEDATLRSFFTQSLDLKAKRWKLNLDTLEAEMTKIMGFPDNISGSNSGRTLFLSGGDSDYVLPEHRAKIRDMFPKAAFVKISGTGHWLHAEKPTEFIATVRAWLNR